MYKTGPEKSTIFIIKLTFLYKKTQNSRGGEVKRPLSRAKKGDWQSFANRH